MPHDRRGYCELVLRSPKLADRLSKQTPYRPLYITVFSRFNAGPGLNAGSKLPVFKQTRGAFTEPPYPPAFERGPGV